jgi:hypothetical protein
MGWTKKDKVLFRIIQEFGDSDIEAQIQKSTEMFFQKPTTFTVFGYYDAAHHQFVWQQDMNRRMEQFIRGGYQPLFGSDRSWKKLFRSRVPLPPRYQNVIPYLMEMLNAQYRVIQFVHDGHDTYAFVELPVKQTFSFDAFSNAMFLYRMDDEMEHKYGSKRQRMRRQTRSRKSRSKSRRKSNKNVKKID